MYGLASLALSGLLLLLAQGQPRPNVVVALDGSGDFTSVQSAVDSFGPAGGVIRIRAGLYREKIVIDKAKVELRGTGGDPRDVVLSWNLNAKTAGGTFKSASTTVNGDDFYAEDLTFENTYSRGRALEEGSQAVALRVTGDRAVFRRVRFLGHQDTLYATTAHCMNEPDQCRPARQYFADCYVEGNVDYIFGDALAYFENCQIHSLVHSMVAITAQSKMRTNYASGYVFDRCRLTAEPGAARVYLGRPWRAYATVVFLNTQMSAEVAPAGWLEWEHDGKLSLPTAYYAEFGSKGPGANAAARDSHSHQLTAEQAEAYRVKVFLRGEDGWDPTQVR